MKIVALSVIPMMAVMSIASAPAYGQNLLGIIGASGEDALVTIGSGNASSSGLVNLGLGGGGNQVLDAQIGGQNDLVNANVTAGGSSALGANASVLGGAARVGATVGGGNLLDLDVGVGGGGGTGGGGGNGGGGNGGGNGAGVGGGGAGGGQLPLATAAAGGGGAATCAGASANDIQRLINRTQIDASWQRASNVEVRRVDVCPEMRSWLATNLRGSAFGSSLNSAIRTDSLLSASLARSSYGVDRVFAVEKRGNRLTMFVY